MTDGQILHYAARLNITLSRADCEEIKEYAREYGIADYRTALWDYLDEFEGIAHSRDADYWRGRE